MHGVVSLLSQPYYSQVELIWNELEEKFGLNGIRVTPYPHFSWQIGSDYDIPSLRTAFNALSTSLPPFEVTTTGLGLFTGRQPVLFVPVVKTEHLVKIHRVIWETLLPLTTNASEYYDPTRWVPHISLAYADLSLEKIGPVMELLAFRDFNWRITVDNLAFIYEPDGSVGQKQIETRLQG